jgi:hypothetical protein
MILLQNNIDRQILLKFLAEGICQVSFTKVKDNTNRILLCTLDVKQIPSSFAKAIEGVYKPTIDEDLLPVWDITDGKWKSFRISKINSFRTPDELLKNDKSGPDTDSSQKQEIVKRKNDANKKFQERVEKLKEQAKQAKNKINGVKDESEA